MAELPEDPLDDDSWGAPGHPEDYNPEPPDWYYLLVGRVASETVLLEYYVAALALRIKTGAASTDRAIRKRLGDTRDWSALLESVEGDPAFGGAGGRVRALRSQRHEALHGILWWVESDGPYADYFERRRAKGDQTQGVGRDMRHQLEQLVEELVTMTTEIIDRERALALRQDPPPAWHP